MEHPEIEELCHRESRKGTQLRNERLGHPEIEELRNRESSKWKIGKSINWDIQKLKNSEFGGRENEKLRTVEKCEN